jgi:hypothetical protein
MGGGSPNAHLEHSTLRHLSETLHSARLLIPYFVAGKFAMVVDPAPQQGINKQTAMSRHVLPSCRSIIQPYSRTASYSCSCIAVQPRQWFPRGGTAAERMPHQQGEITHIFTPSTLTQ